MSAHPRFAIVLAAAGLSLASAEQALARRGGPPAGVSGSIASNGINCSVCHFGSLGFSGSVEILGAPQDYALNTLYNLSVRISDPEQAGAGFELSVEDALGNHVGALLVTDGVNTQLNAGDPNYIHHTGAGVDNAVADWGLSGNSAVYNFDWVSPSGDVGPITFWAAGNAINNNFSSSGDHVYTISVTAEGPPPQGACCSPDDSCTVTEESACAGAFIVDAECDHPEACCFGGQCSETAGLCCDVGDGVSAGVATCEDDADGDGVDGACGDACPNDGNKLVAGICGCGVSDADGDLDTVADCDDQCPGQDDTIDDNHDTIPDCLQFQAIPATTAWGLAIMALLLLVGAKLRFGLAATA